MKVKQLIKKLQKCNQESIVILQQDPEGNGSSPLDAIDNDTVYEADSTWSGLVYNKTWTAEDVDMEKDDWEKFKKKTPDCVVLYPVN